MQGWDFGSGFQAHKGRDSSMPIIMSKATWIQNLAIAYDAESAGKFMMNHKLPYM